MSEWGDMLAILQGDAELASSLPGGIWDRPLSPTDPAMKDVVWVPNAITGIKHLRPCAVLLEPQEVDSPMALNPGRRLDSESWPELVLYAERADMAVFEQADERAMELLHGRVIGTTEIKATGYRARPLEADELPGDVWTTVRGYRAQRSWHIAGV
jgi:hypothetical protein